MQTQTLDAPKNIRIYDAGDSVYDRFTVVFLDEPERRAGFFLSLAMSENPRSPQGFGQHTTAMDGSHLGKPITFGDLPQECKSVLLDSLSTGG